MTTPRGSHVEDNQPLLGHREMEPLPIWKLITLTICFLGVQFGWACQIAFTSPLFLELGVPKLWVSFVWLAGPISGLLVQPTVGVLSDRCTHAWGKRRPFIFFGSLSIVAGMLLISNASSLGSLMGDSSDSNPIAIVLAIIGFWILDLSNNTVQGPCRALLVDVAPPSQHNLGGSFFSFMLGCGNLIGYLTGSLKLSKYLPFFETDIRALFTIGMVVLLSCILTTVLLTKEVPLRKEDLPEGPQENPFVKIFRGLLKMPKAMIRVCAVQFFTWVGWFAFFLFMTTWVGENVYGGDPDADDDSHAKHLFDDGVRAGSLALSFYAAVTMVFSLVLPYLIKYLGVRLVYSAGQIVFAVCLMLPLWVDSKVGAMLLIAACGIPWSVVMVLPFTLVAMAVDEKESGMYMGVLNIFVVIPQIVVAVGVGGLVDLFGGNVAVALFAGGCSSVVSAVLCWGLIVSEKPVFAAINGGGH